MAPCQASMSAATQNLALDLLQNVLSSRLAYAVLGSVQSLTHEGARTMWRDGQHAHAPSTSMRGVVESHTLPECLMFVSLCFPSHKTFQDLTLYEVFPNSGKFHSTCYQRVLQEFSARYTRGPTLSSSRWITASGKTPKWLSKKPWHTPLASAMPMQSC